MTIVGKPTFYPEGGPTAIRDGAVAVLKATGYFKNVFRQKATPTKDDQLPYAAVWIVRDETAPMGDANVGTPSFDHTYTLCIDVGMSATSDDALTATLDDLSLKTRTALLCDNEWRQTFEGIERCSIHPVYPKETNVIFVQAAIEVVVTFRSIWPPYLANDFEGVDVTVASKSAWICSFCHTANKPQAIRCGVCRAPVPQATTFTAEFNTSEPPLLNPITVYATKASALLIKHPHAHKMTLTGAIWPKDGFTGRRLRDGSVTMDKAKAYAPPQPDKAVAPSAPASADHAD